MKNDRTITRSKGNIFADLGLPNAEDHLLKAQIVAMIGDAIRVRGLTQNAAALVLRIRQPDVSKLLRGSFEGFSLERLLGFLQLLGHGVRIEVEVANENFAPGHLTLDREYA